MFKVFIRIRSPNSPGELKDLVDQGFTSSLAMCLYRRGLAGEYISDTFRHFLTTRAHKSHLPSFYQADAGVCVFARWLEKTFLAHIASSSHP